MAFATGNVDREFGLMPQRHYKGGLVRANEYNIASAYNTSVFSGDLVKSTGTNKQIEVCVANDAARGVFVGVYYTLADGTPKFSPYWPANTALLTGTTAKAMVIDDPDVLFMIQASGDFVADDIGAGADILAGTGNVATGTSAMQLDSTSIAVNADRNLLIVGLDDKENNAFGINAKVQVLIQKHELNALMTAV